VSGRARPALRALAAAAGILPGFRDIRGRSRRTADATRVALLHAMGLDASTEDSARHALAALERETRDRLLPPVRVVPCGRSGAVSHLSIALTLPGASAGTRYALEITAEDGTRHAVEGRLGRSRRPRLPLPPDVRLGPGYHALRLTLTNGARERRDDQMLIIAPSRCPMPADRLGSRQAFGVTVNLWTVRSRENWGAGDLSDLGSLAEAVGRAGAALVGLNPLNALRNEDGEVSPYSPQSRLFRNPLYLDVTAAPEFAESPAARALVTSAPITETLRQLRAADAVHHDRVMALKEPVIEALHHTFAERHRDRDTPRGLAYRRFLAQQGEALTDFATFGALLGQLSRDARGIDWHAWPEAVRDPRSEAVRRFRRNHAEVIDRHRYVQFELERQLEAAAGRAGRAGLALGLAGDLAVGSAPAGSDPWAFPGLFVDGASLGAPPDDFQADGQDWALAPLHPGRLREDRYRYWIRLLRATLAHMGALRVDHVMGLLRQYWIPTGRPGSEGAYVEFPVEDLFAILALESHRRGALVIGEDLGTVPPEIPPLLRRWGVLSTSVLYFERDRRGRFLPARRYPRRAFVAAHTHDQAPLAGFWEGTDLDRRRRAGDLSSDRALERARRGRARDRAALLARLAAEHVLPDRRSPSSALELAPAVYRFLSRTPAPLLGVSFDDLSGEREPVNLPGVSPRRFPLWVRRPRLAVEQLGTDPTATRILQAVARRALPRPWDRS
jgi:4-alpha-glucanotransferase